MIDLKLMRSTVAWCSGLILAAWFAFCMALPASDRPVPVRFSVGEIPQQKADLLPMQNKVPPELVEEEKDEPMPLDQVVPPVDPPEVPVLPAPVPPLRYQSKDDEQPKAERHASAKPKDVCERHGLRKQTYYKHRHESWRCVHE